MSFPYDANGRMVKATKTSLPDANSMYDAAGMRVAERVNDVWRFLIYDIGGKLVAEYGGQPSSSEGGVRYVVSDWQGSTRATVNNSGFVKSRTDYTPFGEDLSAGTGTRTTNQGFGSTNDLRQKDGLTERDDATGLDHTWFRKHENLAGRWTSPDPYNGSASIGSPQSWNRYAYVENQPTNFVDPSGLNMAFIVCWDVVTDGHYTNDPSTNWVNTTTVCHIFGGSGSTWDDPDPTVGGWDFVSGGSGGDDVKPGDVPYVDSQRFKDCVGEKIKEEKKQLLHLMKESLISVVFTSGSGVTYSKNPP